MPARPLCDCGYTRTDYADGYLICLHCDLGCENKCARCRTYDAVAQKRISA